MVIRAIFFLSLLFLSAGLKAQKPELVKAEEIIRHLKQRRFPELTGFAAANSQDRLAPEVFMQINSAITTGNGQMNVGGLSAVMINGQRAVRADLPDKHQDLVMCFNAEDLLTEFYLETQPYWVQKRQHKDFRFMDAEYADTTLFEERHITVQTAEFILPGTLTIPKGKKKFPIVVYVHGSGDSDREENIYGLSPFRDLAAGLAAKGIASLRYDKRTNVYGKAAVPSYKFLTIREETTDDAASAIKLALAVPGASSVYLIGHSLGGMMAPQIAVENRKLSGIIILSGPARSFQKSIEDQLVNIKPKDQATLKSLREIELIKHADTISDQGMMLMDRPAVYWGHLSKYNQLEVVKNVRQPILILQGERDFQVPFSDLALWQHALKGKRKVTFKAYPKINHFYGEGSGTASVMEYLKRSAVPLYVIDDIANWVLKNSSDKF